MYMSRQTQGNTEYNALGTSDCAKCRILDESTVILKYFWKMAIARSEDLNKDDVY